MIALNAVCRQVSHAKNRKYFHVPARVQARWNKLKDVLEFVSDAPIETQATIDLGNWLNVDSR